MCVILSEPTAVVSLTYCAPLPIHPYPLQNKTTKKNIGIYIVLYNR